MDKNETTKNHSPLGKLKRGIWILGISSWLFGIIDRSFASLADGYLSAIDVTQLFTAAFFFVSWLVLKPLPFD